MDAARTLIALMLLVTCAGAADQPAASAPLTDPFGEVTRGALRVVRPDGAVVECPLSQSAYHVDIAGPVAQVTLVQVFRNPFPEAIEAVYVFPLSNRSGVNSLEMEVGDRRIVGALLKRADAQAVYDQAKQAGRTASLLDQERPNIFTQRIANLPPSGEVRIRIGYAERLAYDRGAYEFHLPLVVGPRFIPGSPISGVAPQDPAVAAVAVPVAVPPGEGAPSGTGRSPDTNQVPDASRITPPVLRPEMKPPFGVTIAVRVAAGLPIRDVRSVHHRVRLERPDAASATLALDPSDGVPNKDFVLRYAVDGERPAVGVVTHRADDGGYLLLTLQPGQLDQTLAQRVPRDLCFLVDVSGSMKGQPLAKVKEAMGRFLTLASPQDRVQVVVFASEAQTCFPDYLPATPENIKAAIAAADRQEGGGGTQMLAGITAVLAAPLDPVRQRAVVMLTDGYIGNEAEIIKELNARLSERLRFWCLGIGSSPNRFLVDGVAEVGGGMGMVLGLDEDALPVVSSMMSRLQHPQLEQVEIDWGGLPVSDVVPARIPGLWSGQPVRVAARCAGDGRQNAIVTVRGRCEGAEVAIPVTVTVSPATAGTAAVRTIWARERSAELQYEQVKTRDANLVGPITDLCLKYSLMSPYTSFVAVDERIINPGGTGRRIDVAVPLPEGVGITALPVIERGVIEARGKELAEAGGAGTGDTFEAVGAGGGTAGMFGSRIGGGRVKAGSAVRMSTVNMGLRFLKRHQSPNGSWDPVTYQLNCVEAVKCEAGKGGPDDRIALTAQSILCFLASGYDHKTPSPYRVAVERAIEFLCAQQQADGAFAATIEAHAQGLTALAELMALTNDPALKKPAERAIAWLLSKRLAGADGKPFAWGDAQGVSTASTLEAVFALKSCATAGLNEGNGRQRAQVWVESAWKLANPGWKTLQEGQSTVFPARCTMAGVVDGDDTAAGAVLMVLLGKQDGDQPLASLMREIRQRLSDPAKRASDPRVFYLATFAGYRIGGEWWEWWNKTGLPFVTTTQRTTEDCSQGSWDPPADLARGRLQSTVFFRRAEAIFYFYKQVGAPTKP